MSDAIVVVGASAGGVEALRAFVSGLPVDLPAPVVVVLHIPRSAPSALPAILTRAGPLVANSAEHGAPLRAGVIYTAPADHHVLVVDGQVHLSLGPVENGHRPAIDPLFRSAAVAYGPTAVGVVLSGTRDDGTAGLAAIAARGGRAFVQEPADALYDAMPASALAHVPGARAYPAAKIGGEIAELLTNAAVPADPPADDLLLAERAIAALDPDRTSTAELRAAEPSGLSCPNCEGSLFELPGSPEPRFRCRVGHAWSPASLAAGQADGVEHAMWAALRALEERAALQRRLASLADRRGNRSLGDLHRAKAARGEANAGVIRRLLAEAPVGGADKEADQR
jgi:two-component system, chemotaxis family, protein-glutamate methylesterase/glutaminase